MRFIDLANNPPPEDLIEEGKTLTEELLSLPENERSDFIDANKNYWGKLQEHYLSLSHKKCWYTEAKEIASAYHMDHFRPKKKMVCLKKSEGGVTTVNNDCSYWWLAFEWTNLRLSASLPNSRKNCYFPLQDKTYIAQSCEDDIQKEIPALIDPTDPNDVIWLDVDSEGQICPIPDSEGTWEADRVHISIRVYNLNYPLLVDERKKVQTRCETLIKEYIRVYKDADHSRDAFARDLMKTKIVELKAMCSSEAELSMTARQYLLASEYPQIRRLATMPE